MQNNAKSKLYCFVARLRAELGISKTNYPLDVLKICESDGTTNVVFHEFSSDGFCGAAFVGDETDTIVLNEYRDHDERNFDCGHEVIHLTKHRNENGGIFNCSEKLRSSFLEWEANEGSAEFIVPYEAFIPNVCSAYSSFDRVERIIEFKRDMVHAYRATPAIIDNRLDNLKYEIQQYIDGTSISNLVFLSRREQQLQGIIAKSVIDLENELFSQMWNTSRAKTKNNHILCGV